MIICSRLIVKLLVIMSKKNMFESNRLKLCFKFCLCFVKLLRNCEKDALLAKLVKDLTLCQNELDKLWIVFQE